MTLLHPRPTSTETLAYDREANLLVGEASTLGLRSGEEFDRVWNDSCDVGLTLVSHRTGQEVVFAVDHEEIRDGDILYWDLKPVDHVLATLRIFND